MADDQFEFPGRAWAAPDGLGLVPQSPGPPLAWGPWATIGWSLVIFFAWMAVQVGVTVIYFVFLTVTNRQPDLAGMGTDGLLLGISTLASLPVLLGLTTLLGSVRRMPVRDYLGLRWPKAGPVALATLGLLLVVVATDGLTLFLRRPIVSPVMLEMFRSAPVSLMLVVALICAPVGEEYLFRGFAYRGLADSKWGPGMAIGLTSMAWAAIHLQYDLYGIASIYLMGLYLGTVRYLTGSTQLTIWLHFLANAVAMAEAALFTDWLG